jgi:glutamyl-tRNA synthetase
MSHIASEKSPFVRFAPSPTGYLHVGNVRTALVNWLFARAAGGRFLLRLDDTDTDRSKPEYVSGIEEDLNWLGLMWDDFKKQSDRFASYEVAKARLMESGRLYPCYETQEELDIRRKLLAGRGLPPIYDRAALKLTPEQLEKYKAEGRKPHYRFLLEAKPITWRDLIRGEVKFQGAHVSDPVLMREDGVPLYTLASVVDDGEMGITHIIRGEDHVSNTAVQVQIFEALGFAVPQFGHLALLKTKEGEMSKRLGGNDIRSLRDAGIEPMAVCSLLARMGTSDAIEPFVDMRSLIAGFDMSKFGRATANYDAHELERLNEKLIAHMSFADAKPRLAALGFAQVDETFWTFIRGNLKTLADVGVWWGIVHGDIAHAASTEDRGFLAKAAELLPPEPWTPETWGQWTKAVSAATGRKGKELFHPLRSAITGREDGPELKALLGLLGYKNVIARLKAA